MARFIPPRNNGVSIFSKLAAIGFAVALPFAPALAEEQIGIAVTVRNEVTGKLQTNTVRVNDGSDVFGKEIVKTQADASAKIVLKDSTNLNVGPNSSVTLDKFVFAGPSDYKQASFSIAKGAFRFASGSSDKRAYDIKTPQATIGVRGTDFSVLLDPGSTHIEVDHGNVIVCTRQETREATREERRKPRCTTLTDGQAANVSNNSVTPSQFTGQASQAACVGPCDTLTFPQAQQAVANPTPPGAQGASGLTGGLSGTQLAGLAFTAAAVAGGTTAGVVAGSNQNQGNGPSPEQLAVVTSLLAGSGPPQPLSGQ